MLSAGRFRGNGALGCGFRGGAGAPLSSGAGCSVDSYEGGGSAGMSCSFLSVMMELIGLNKMLLERTLLAGKTMTRWCLSPLRTAKHPIGAYTVRSCVLGACPLLDVPKHYKRFRSIAGSVYQDRCRARVAQWGRIAEVGCLLGE
jgi:hypothetical protein